MSFTNQESFFARQENPQDSPDALHSREIQKIMEGAKLERDEFRGRIENQKLISAFEAPQLGEDPEKSYFKMVKNIFSRLPRPRQSSNAAETPEKQPPGYARRFLLGELRFDQE